MGKGQHEVERAIWPNWHACYVPQVSNPTQSGSVDIVLHEPSLTADNLGLKTWASSYLLAKRLHLYLNSLKQLLELSASAGAGIWDGAMGIAAAAVWE
jgi:D-xylulose reductase